MNELSELLHWGWMMAFGVIAYFLKDFHNKVVQQERIVRRLELEVQKQGTENEALFQRMDEVKQCLRDLTQKLDTLILRSKGG